MFKPRVLAAKGLVLRIIIEIYAIFGIEFLR